MAEEVSGIPRIAVERSQRDFPRREGQQQGNRRKPPRQQLTETPAAPPPGEDPPLVGSRLNVRA
jgi:hypothetical protein